jgi:hypothetical protein
MGEATQNESARLLVRSSHGGGWRPPHTSAYGGEADLQALLEEQPSLLPGVGEDAVATRELYVPETGSVDVVAVDQTGRITLAECKLGSNPEMRRHVVGQLLAYASGLWRTDFARFDANWRARDGDRSLLVALLGEEGDPDEQERLREAISTNLVEGQFNLVLVVDEITVELRRIIEYLNAHTVNEVSVLALELMYAREADLEIVLPRLYGLRACRCSPLHYRERVELYYWGQGASPSVTATFRFGGWRVQPWSIYTGDYLGVAVNFDWMKALGDERRSELLRKLLSIPGTEPKLAGVAEAGFAKRPTLPLAGVLDQPTGMDRFIDAFDAALA